MPEKQVDAPNKKKDVLENSVEDSVMEKNSVNDSILKQAKKYDTMDLLNEILNRSSSKDIKREDSDSSDKELSAQNIEKKEDNTSFDKQETQQKVDTQKTGKKTLKELSKELDEIDKPIISNSSEEKTEKEKSDNDIVNTIEKEKTIEKTIELEQKPEIKEDKKVEYTKEQLQYLQLQKNRKKYMQGFKMQETFVIKEKIEEAIDNIEESMKPEDIVSVEQMKLEVENKELIEEVQEENTQKDVVEEVAKENTQDKQSTENEATDNSTQNIEDDTTPSEEAFSYKDVKQKEEVKTTLAKMKKSSLTKVCLAGVLFFVSCFVNIVGKTGIDSIQNTFSFLQEPMGFIVSNLVLTLLGAVICFDCIKDTVKRAWTGKIGRYGPLVIAFVGLFCYQVSFLFNPGDIEKLGLHLYTPVILMSVVFVSIGKLTKINRVCKNFDILCISEEKYSLDFVMDNALIEECKNPASEQNPNVITTVKTEFLSDFVEQSFCDDVTDKVSNTITPIVFICGLVIAVASYFLGQGVYASLNLLCGVYLIGFSCISTFVVVSPIDRANKRLEKDGAMILGYDAVEKINKADTLIINSSDLFEKDDIKLFGIKAFSNSAIDRAILDATSVLCETQSVLSEVFLDIISNNRKYLDKVDNIVYEDGMGLSAWVNNRRVLIGSRELMVNHSIQVPKLSTERKLIEEDQTLIYLSTSGELSAVFLIGAFANENNFDVLMDLYDENVTFVVKSVDSFLTKDKLCEIFDMPDDAFQVISSRHHKNIQKEMDSNEPKSAAASLCGGYKVARLFNTMLSCKYLHKNIQWGIVIQIMFMAVGILTAIIFTALNGISQVSDLVFCVYQIISVLVCYVIMRCKKV